MAPGYMLLQVLPLDKQLKPESEAALRCSSIQRQLDSWRMRLLSSSRRAE